MLLALKWTEKKRQQFIESIQKHKEKRVQSGVSCMYFPLSKTVGAKVYQTLRGRNSARDKQIYVAKFGMAPLVGDSFSYESIYFDLCYGRVKYKVVYGYLTQNAIVPRDLSEDDEYYLYDRLRAIGIVNHDLVPSNVGYIGQRLVCIDFDTCSCKWERGRKINV